MSVIAKMNITHVKELGGNYVFTFHSTYDNDLSQPDNEDVRFTKATPYGSGEMTVEVGPVLPPAWTEKEYPHEATYFLFNDRGDIPSFDGCVLAAEVVCHETIDQGYTKQAQINGYWTLSDDSEIPLEKRMGKKKITFSLKMGIDNEAASMQFKPTKRYWLTIYDAKEYTLKQVLSIARSK